jgi:hypothetical protein
MTQETSLRRGNLLSALLVAVVLPLGLAQAASASVATYPVMNTDEQPPDGVWFRNGPRQADTSREAGFGVYRGESIAVDCWSPGDSVGPYGNTIWYRGLNASRPRVNGHANYGYLNTHYVNDGMNAGQAAPGVPNCSAPAPAPAPQPAPAPTPAPEYCFLALRIDTPDVSWFYEGGHRYLGNARAAAEAWNNSGAGVRFTEVSSKSKANLVITDYDEGADTAFAHTSFGNVVGMSASRTPTRALLSVGNIRVNRAVMDKYPVPARNDVRDSTLTHEFGHVLGLAHPESCGLPGEGALMREGGDWVRQPNAVFHTSPRPYDVAAVRKAFAI